MNAPQVDCQTTWMKDKANAYACPNQIMNNFKNFINGRLINTEDILSFRSSFIQEDNKNLSIQVKQLIDLVISIKSKTTEIDDKLS